MIFPLTIISLNEYMSLTVLIGTRYNINVVSLKMLFVPSILLNIQAQEFSFRNSVAGVAY